MVEYIVEVHLIMIGLVLLGAMAFYLVWLVYQTLSDVLSSIF